MHALLYCDIYIIYWCFAYRNRSSSRESTPCSLIRDADSIGITPGSTTRRTSIETNHRRVRNIPTTQEMEEFFARAEQEHQRIFIDK